MQTSSGSYFLNPADSLLEEPGIVVQFRQFFDYNLLLDIGFGILLAIITSNLFDAEPTTKLMTIGVLFALLPDIDVIPELLKYKKIGGKETGFHREVFHYPLLYVPVGVFVWLLAGQEYAFLFTTAVFAHFLHDSVGIGWGIKWLAPFSKRNYKFFSNKDGSSSSKLMVSWHPNELRDVVSQHGNPHWIRDTYLRPSLINLVELAGFIMALILWYIF